MNTQLIRADQPFVTQDDFIQFISVKKGLSQNSVRNCVIRYKVFMRFLDEYGFSLSRETVEKFLFYLRDKGLKNSSLNTYLFMLSYLQDYCTDRNVPLKFFHGFKSFEKKQAVIEPLTAEEIHRILAVRLQYKSFRGTDAFSVTAHLDNTYSTFTMFLAFTGCRFEEAASLKVQDIDLAAAKVIFRDTKNKQWRAAHLTDPLLSRIANLCYLKARDAHVFQNVVGHKIRPQEYQLDLRRRAQAAGITKRVHPHLFRHSFATQLIKSGVDVTIVASLLGHKDIQTTFKNYVHLADDNMKKATFRHPLIRESVDPRDILKQIKENVQGFNIEQDPRFAYEINESGTELQIRIAIRHNDL